MVNTRSSTPGPKKGKKKGRSIEPMQKLHPCASSVDTEEEGPSVGEQEHEMNGGDVPTDENAIDERHSPEKVRDGLSDPETSAMAIIKKHWKIKHIFEMIKDGTWLKVPRGQDTFDLATLQSFAELAQEASQKMSREQIMRWLVDRWTRRQSRGELGNRDWITREMHLRENIKMIIDLLKDGCRKNKVAQWKRADEEEKDKAKTAKNVKGNVEKEKDKQLLQDRRASPEMRAARSISPSRADLETERRATSALLAQARKPQRGR